MARRLFDCVFAMLAVITLWPLAVLAAAGIKLSSAGPVFFRARRVGRNGVEFELLKFRTMHVGNESGARITAACDARVFPFGRLLRDTKIDELPQFVNVLRGDMAIIGPRPEDPSIVRTAYREDGWVTLRVAPGLASPGSIYNYTHGEHFLQGDAERAYVERLLPLKLALDRVYVERASVVYDMRLIGRTLIVLGTRLLGRRRFADPPEMAAVRRSAASNTTGRPEVLPLH
jgi:lipopolysaccharide/colanic/teichoic acid biosynthesis glycosyltransferase